MSESKAEIVEIKITLRGDFANQTNDDIAELADALLDGIGYPFGAVAIGEFISRQPDDGRFDEVYGKYEDMVRNQK